MPVRVEGCKALQAEATFQTDPKRLLIHLINRTGDTAWNALAQKSNSGRMYTTGQPHELPPIHDVTVSIKKSFWNAKKIYLAPERQDIPYKEVGDEVVISLDKLGIYTILAVE